MSAPSKEGAAHLYRAMGTAGRLGLHLNVLEGVLTSIKNIVFNPQPQAGGDAPAVMPSKAPDKETLRFCGIPAGIRRPGPGLKKNPLKIPMFPP